MNLMVELYDGTTRVFTNNMELISGSPMVLVKFDQDGRKVEVGRVRRIFTERKR